MAKVILEFETLEELNEVFAQARKKFETETHELVTPRQEYVDSKTFEQLMYNKGYKVRSLRAKKRNCEKLSIRAEKRGVRWKYNLSDIERVPGKRKVRWTNPPDPLRRY